MSPSSTTPAGGDLVEERHESGRTTAARGRREIRIEFRLADTPFDPEEVQRREKELTRLIVKAACHRARREHGLVGGGEEEKTCVNTGYTGKNTVSSVQSKLIRSSEGAA